MYVIKHLYHGYPCYITFISHKNDVIIIVKLHRAARLQLVALYKSLTTTKRPTYAEILSRPKSQNQETRPRRQISFQREQSRRESRSVQFREVNGELEEGKHPSYHKTRRQLKQFRTLHDPSGEVVNLSNKLFTNHEFKLLKKGLSFCPIPQQYSRLNFNKDLQSFFDRIKVRTYFGINDTNREPAEEEIFSCKEKSNWTLNQNSHTVAAVTNDISQIPMNKQPKDNLTKDERKTPHSLNPISTGLFCLVVALGGGVFSTPLP